METRRFLKSTGTIGILTTVSRVFGYARDAVLAYVLGAGSSMDAFTIAYRLANLFRRLLAEGAMTAAFVPVFSEFREQHTEKDLWDFTSKFFYTLALVLCGIVALQIVFAPALVSVMAPGFIKDPQKWDLTVFLNRLMAPYLFFIGLAAVLMGVLNSMRSYAVSAANPIFFNLMVIFSAFTVSKCFDEPAIGISLGVLFGGFLQMFVQVPAVWKKGMRFIPSVSFNHPAIRKISLLMTPGMIGIGIYQINLLVDSIMSSFLPEGSVSSIYYSTRVVELVQGIFVVSFATVMLTEMSSLAAKKDHAQIKESLSFSLRMVAFVAIPASAGLIMLARPITQVLFEHGKFAAFDTERTAFALIFYAVGLFFVAGARIVVQAFYAVQDTATPVKCAFVSLVVNIAGNLILMHPLKQGGIALATSIAAAVNLLQLLLIYQKRCGALDWGPLKESLVRIGIQTFAMTIGSALFLNLLRFHEQKNGLLQAASLFGTIILALLVYLAVALLLKSRELGHLASSSAQTLPPEAGD